MSISSNNQAERSRGYVSRLSLCLIVAQCAWYTAGIQEMFVKLVSE